MTFDLKAMLADREAGTPGPWRIDSSADVHTYYLRSDAPATLGEASFGDEDWRRIARVHDMEEEIIRLSKFEAAWAEAEGKLSDAQAEISRLTARVQELESGE